MARVHEDNLELLKDLDSRRRAYARLRGQDPNRLQASSVLGGLTFAALVALTASPDPSPARLTNLEWPPASGHILPIVTAGLLASATLVLLISTVSAYQVIRLINRLSPTSIARLVAVDDVDIDEADQPRLLDAYRIHTEAAGFITLGVEMLMGVILCIALEIHVIVAGIVVLAIGALLAQLPTLRRALR
jgi:hypothetical protein